MRALRPLVLALCIPFLLAAPAGAGPQKVPLPKPRPAELAILDHATVIRKCAASFRDLQESIKAARKVDRRMTLAEFNLIDRKFWQTVYATQASLARLPKDSPQVSEMQALVNEVRGIRRAIFTLLGIPPFIVTV